MTKIPTDKSAATLGVIPKVAGEEPHMVSGETPERAKSCAMKQIGSDGGIHNAMPKELESEENSGQGYITSLVEHPDGNASQTSHRGLESEENSEQGFLFPLFEHLDCGHLSITSNADSFTLKGEGQEVTITLKYESSEDAPQWVVSKTETTFRSLGEALKHVGVVG
tara:strand:+ start:140 stop:640 length:501 start_codon:yes stop_codon:yes gene_type:complete